VSGNENKLSWSQAVIEYFVPRATFARMRRESEAWKLTCPKCGYTTNYWAQGGMRFGATSHKKTTPGRCPQCKEWVAFEVEDTNETPAEE